MITIDDILQCSSVKLCSHKAFESCLLVTTDSRRIEGKNTFIALKGENFNGNDYINDVIAKGLEVVIFSSDQETSYEEVQSRHKSIVFIDVTSTYDFILELARVVSLRWQSLGGQTIGITGSNGKTTNKEMMFALLDEVFPEAVNKTQGNLNNHIGVPLTIFNLSEKHKVNLVEMGMNHRHEIQPLVNAANPSAGLITSIGPAHLENLGSIENIFLEKKTLYDWVDSLEVPTAKKCFVVNDRDTYLKKLPEQPWCHRLNEDNLVLVNKGFKLHYQGRTISIENKKIYGDHSKLNLAQCFYLCFMMFPEHEEKFIAAANSFQMPSMNRGDFFKIEDTYVYLDAYNANPASVRSSLDAFTQRCHELEIPQGERLYILGDMNELGEDSLKLHQETGRYLKDLGVEKAWFVGAQSEHWAKGFSRDAQTFADRVELKKSLDKELRAYKAVFIKASRSLQLESIIDINDSLT